MIRILALAGSLRHGSYNRLLLHAAAESTPAGMTVHLSDALESVPLFDADREQDPGAGTQAVRRLRQEVASADGLLISTPEYNHSIPGVLKNAIDWLSRPGPDEVLIGKPVAVIGASSGRWGTRLAQAALRQVLYSTEALVLPKPTMFVAEAQQLFDGAGRLVHDPTRQLLQTVLAEFAKWIALVAPRAPGSGPGQGRGGQWHSPAGGGLPGPRQEARAAG